MTDKERLRGMRRRRIRAKVSGTAERPRLSVFRSLKNIHAQLIDDDAGMTLAAASSVEKDVAGGGNAAGAKTVGQRIAERAVAKGLKRVVFDRGGNQYHGRVKALAEAAREGGLQF